MMYKVVPSERARKDILDIIGYITSELDSPEAARKLLIALYKEMNSLDTMPKRFAFVSDERLAQMGIRSIPVKNYIIFYTVDEQKKSVTIIRVMYSKRDWANLL